LSEIVRSVEILGMAVLQAAPVCCDSYAYK